MASVGYNVIYYLSGNFQFKGDSFLQSLDYYCDRFSPSYTRTVITSLLVSCLKMFLLAIFNAYGMHFHTDPLRQYATDFMRLVNIKTLAPVLFKNNL